jgi:hypothetical protein
MTSSTLLSTSASNIREGKNKKTSSKQRYEKYEKKSMGGARATRTPHSKQKHGGMQKDSLQRNTFGEEKQEG